MATYEISGPDGAVYHIDGPEGASHDDLVAAVQKQAQPQAAVQPQGPRDRMAFAPGNLADYAPPMSAGDTAKDLAKSFGVGLARGGIGLATIPGNIEQLGRLGINKGAEAMGFRAPVSSESFFPNAAQFQNEVEKDTGKFYEPKSTAGEYARTIGEFAPLAVGGEAGLAGRAANVLAPAVASETAGQLTKGTVAEPWARAAAGIFGAPLPSAAMRTISPLAVDATRAGHIANLGDQGVTALTAGQKTGNRAVRYMESAAADAPFGGGRARSTEATQGEQFTRAAWQHAGIDASDIKPATVDAAFSSLGDTFNDLAKATSFRVDPKLLADLGSARASYERLVPASMRAPIVSELGNDIAAMADSGGNLAGGQYQTIRSMIGKAQANNRVSNPTLSNTLGDIQDALDDAMQRTASPQVAQAWQTARTQYKRLLAIAKAAAAPGENTANGVLSPSALRTAVKQQNDRAFVRGKDPLGELARSGEAIMKPLPNSGTPARQNLRNLVSAGGAAVGAATAGLPGAVVGAVAPTAAHGLAAWGMMNPLVQRALANQVMARPINAYNAGRLAPWWRLPQGLADASGSGAASNGPRSGAKK